jgi:hypothetical protein
VFFFGHLEGLVLLWKDKLRYEPNVKKKTKDVILDLLFSSFWEFQPQLNFDKFANYSHPHWRSIKVLKNAIHQLVNQTFRFFYATPKYSLHFGVVIILCLLI